MLQQGNLAYLSSGAIVAYTFVKPSTTAGYAVQDVAGTRDTLVALNSVSGSGVSVQCVGGDGVETLLKVDNAYAIGQALKCSTGSLGTAVTASGNLIQAVAREASTANGDIIRVVLKGGTYYST